jgi:hypothetical protein
MWGDQRLSDEKIAGEQQSISQNAPHKRNQRRALEPIWFWLAGSLPNVPDELPPCRSDGRPPIVRKLAPVAPLEIAPHRLGRRRHPLGPALFEAYSQAGDNPELEVDLPDLIPNP